MSAHMKNVFAIFFILLISSKDELSKEFIIFISLSIKEKMIFLFWSLYN